TQVLGVLAEYGWFPASASQAWTRNPAREGYQRHMVRLSNDRFDRQLINVGDAAPQIALVNSHDGAASFRLYAAMMEKVCSNGLIIEVPNKEGLGGYYRIPHVGYTEGKVVEAVRGIAEALPKAFEQRERFKAIRMSFDQQLHYASEAALLRFERRH